MARTAAAARTTAASVATARGRLVDALRPALDGRPGVAPADADRLACLLVGHVRYEAVTGAPPTGSLAALPPPFVGVELPPGAEDALHDLRDAVEALEPTVAAIGAGYEASLGPDARGANGQFYTPAPIARALVRWALDGVAAEVDRLTVLDPAVGTGTFPLAALEDLRGREPTVDPAAWLDRFVGVDVDGVALALAGLRLSAAAGGRRRTDPAPVGLHHASFFDCEPAVIDGASRDAARSADGPSLGPVDAVVGNPPYVRAEALGAEVDAYRRHLAAFGPPGATPWLDGPNALSRRSDAYVYFVTHATRFLRPGGRLALLLPTKWLMSDYGRGLRRFLRERYRVHAVVGFDGRAFGDALVDTALLLAERDDSAGADRPLRFVRLDGPSALAGSADSLTATGADPLVRTDRRGVVKRTQRTLTAAGSLSRYLEVPAEVRSLFDGPAFVRLDALAEVARGTMTGANRCFFVDAEAVTRFDLEPDALRPAVKSLRWVDRPVVGPDDVERWLVDAHDAVAEARAAVGDDPTAGELVEALSTAGYPGLRAYVEHAESAGWHEGRTCQSRAVWFDLGPLRAPVAFVPKLLRERVFVVRNAARAIPSNAIDGVWPADGVDPGALLAVLNASVGTLAMEVTGRDEAGLLQLMTYETASLPTLDVRRCSPAARDRLAAAGAAYADEPTAATLGALDAAVDVAFDLPLPGPSLREHAAALRRRRVDGGERPAAGDG